MRTLWIAIVFLGFSLAVSIPAFSQNPDKKHLTDSLAIQQISANLDAAWNIHDALAFSNLFLEDADFQWHTGDLLKDKKQIEQYFSASFKQIPPEYRHHTTIKRLRFIDPDIAIGDGTIVIVREGATENEKPYMSVLFTCIGKKIDDNWRIAAVRIILPKTD
ncbi:MAG: SgcJ/EcaC family oxidoreductase [Bacteroidales bacterium]|nr:SgcJ/EcaC family oxidoreductase [Bacteroidales bacterium]